MENFKHLPEPFRIRVIEPVKRTSREYREQAILKSGMNPFEKLVLLPFAVAIDVVSLPFQAAEKIFD